MSLFCTSIYFVADLIEIKFMKEDGKFPENYGLYMGTCWFVCAFVTI